MENWSDKYLLNIENIDEQHRGFFELWDKECRNVDDMDWEKLSAIIVKLEDYIKQHFLAEEEILKNSNYPDLENHIAQHEFFIKKIDEMKQELSYRNTLLFEKISVFMKKWFLGHINQSDRSYKDNVIGYLAEEKE